MGRSDLHAVCSTLEARTDPQLSSTFAAHRYRRATGTLADPELQRAGFEPPLNAMTLDG